jgi:drug/metabolite transporter (DMT)-like permease
MGYNQNCCDLCGGLYFKPGARKEKGLVAGFLFFAHVLFYAFAISLTSAACMISVKRLSVVFELICGSVIFKEKNLMMDTIGTLLMVAGALLITIWGRQVFRRQLNRHAAG